MDVVEQVRLAGVVGAGGAGFPTHVKLKAKAEVVIANGAECEPLLRVDQLLMEHRADRLIRGLRLAMEATGAKRGIIATKGHYRKAVAALEAALGLGRAFKNDREAGQGVTLHRMDSYYPSGDEKSVIFEVTGRVVPSGKLPADVGCVVCNVGTLLAVADAVEGKPVTDKAVTLCGDVPRPMTVEAPLGAPVRELLLLAGFSGREEDYGLILGGPLMGRLSEDWSAPVTKTMGGVILLKRNHPLIQKRMQNPERQLRLARSVCCQCSLCTQLCPRNALGLHVEPHKAMRAYVLGRGALLDRPLSLLACSGCGLCTHYACNFGLCPSEVMTMLKAELNEAGVKPQPEDPIRPDPFLAEKRVPVKRLIARMGLPVGEAEPSLQEWKAPKGRKASVVLPLSQHIGKPGVSVVKEGDRVAKGDLIAEIPKGALGARLHASVTGRVVRVTEEAIEIAPAGTAGAGEGCR
ncbi:MAG: SLBB domain-containing protein [Clostridia bacterium]|nr:SLBB domain-containing protein [Clostridia bacterium]